MTAPADRATALAYFVAQGWTPAQSAGIVANLEAESQLNPAAVGDGGAAYGIAQWHPDRQAGFAALLGKPIQGSSLADQLAWVNAELNTTEKKAGDAIRACATAAQAGAVDCTKYERPADPAEAAKRGALAETILATYNAVPAAVPSPEKPMGAALAFLPYILQLVPQLFKIPGLQAAATQVPLPTATGSPHAADYMPLVQSIINAFTAGVPGAVNTQDAVEKAQADANAAAAASQAVLSAPDVVDQLNKLKPVLDALNQYDKDAWAAEEASRDAAQQRGLQQQESGPLYGNPTFIIAMIMLVLVFVVVLAVLFKGGFSTDMQAFVIGAIVGGGLTAVLSFYFGSSRNSAAKDVTISQLANKGTGG